MSKGRGILTEREQEVLLGDGSDSYQANVRSKIRHRIQDFAQDCEILRENEPDLFASLVLAVWYPEWDSPTFQGKHPSQGRYILYKNGTKWNQDYYKDQKITWGEQGGNAGQALTAEILIRESVVSNMTVNVSILKEFVVDFGLNTEDRWKISSRKIKNWLREKYFNSSYDLERQT